MAKRSGEDIQTSHSLSTIASCASAHLQRRMTQASARQYKLMSEPCKIATEYPAEEARGARHWEFHRVTVR